jgi:K+ transporter
VRQARQAKVMMRLQQTTRLSVEIVILLVRPASAHHIGTSLPLLIVFLLFRMMRSWESGTSVITFSFARVDSGMDYR